MKFEQIVNKIIVFNTESKYLQCKFIFHYVVIGGWAPDFTWFQTVFIFTVTPDV